MWLRDNVNENEHRIVNQKITETGDLQVCKNADQPLKAGEHF